MTCLSAGFTGKERDAETGLDFFEARYYSGAQGRFTSPDTGNLGVHLSDPQTWNMYAYTRNNPLRYVDPNGTDVRICIDGSKDCFDLSDEDYARLYKAQNGQQGISLPGGRFPSGKITCGGQKCGTASYFEKGLESATGANLAIGGILGGLVRGAAGLLTDLAGAGTRQVTSEVATTVTTETATSTATAYPTEIAGYKVQQHVIDRMAEDLGHRVPSGVVEQVIKFGQTLPSREPGLVVKYLPGVHEKGVTVLLKEATKEIVMTRVGKP